MPETPGQNFNYTRDDLRDADSRKSTVTCPGPAGYGGADPGQSPLGTRDRDGGPECLT